MPKALFLMRSREDVKILRVGLLVDQIGSQYHSKLVRGAIAACQEKGVELYMFVGSAVDAVRPSEKEQNVIYNYANAVKLDGILITTGLGYYTGNDKLAEYCHRFGPLPMVSISTSLSGMSGIKIDNKVGQKAVVNHFIRDHGYKKIAFLGGPEANEEARIRFDAYRESLDENGLEYDPLYYFEGDFTERCVPGALKAWYEEREIRPDAIAAANDDMAIGLIIKLKQMGLKIPGDVAVSGFDAVERAAFTSPTLTTVIQHFHTLSYRAAIMLFDLIEGRSVPPLVTLPAALVVRESCGCSVFIEEKGEESAIEFLPESKREMKKRFTEAMGFKTESIDYDFREIGKLSEEMAHALVEDLYEGNQGHHLLSFIKESIYAQINMPEEKIWLIRSVLDVLYKLAVSLIKGDELDIILGRVFRETYRLISECFSRIQTNINWDLKNLMEGLLSNCSLEELLEDVARVFPPWSKINCFFIVFYVNDNPGKPNVEFEDIPTEKSRLVLAYNNGIVAIEEEDRIFSSNCIIPEKYLPSEKSPIFVTLPLFYKKNHYGYILLEFENERFPYYSAIANQISINLDAINLFSLIEQSNRELDQLNKNLEQIVKERTAELEAAQDKLLDAAYVAGMAALADSVLKHAGEQYNGIVESIEKLKVLLDSGGHESWSKANRMLSDLKESGLEMLPDYFRELEIDLGTEREKIREEIEAIAFRVDELRAILIKQERYAKIPLLGHKLDLEMIFSDSMSIKKPEMDALKITLDIRKPDPGCKKPEGQNGKVLYVLVVIWKYVLSSLASFSGTRITVSFPPEELRIEVHKQLLPTGEIPLLFDMKSDFHSCANLMTGMKGHLCIENTALGTCFRLLWR